MNSPVDVTTLGCHFPDGPEDLHGAAYSYTAKQKKQGCEKIKLADLASRAILPFLRHARTLRRPAVCPYSCRTTSSNIVTCLDEARRPVVLSLSAVETGSVRPNGEVEAAQRSNRPVGVDVISSGLKRSISSLCRLSQSALSIPIYNCCQAQRLVPGRS